MRILIAEDEPTYSALIQAVLTASGYDVVVTRDGREAWDVLNKEDPPQLSILDWSMPRMDGIDLCRRARSELPAKDLYIILLTGRNTEDDLIQATEAGADDFFTKSSNMEELLLRVNAGRRIVQLQNQLIAARVIAAMQTSEIAALTPGLDSHRDEVYKHIVHSIQSIASHAKKLQEICTTEPCRFYSRDIYEMIRAMEHGILTMQKNSRA